MFPIFRTKVFLSQKTLLLLLLPLKHDQICPSTASLWAGSANHPSRPRVVRMIYPFPLEWPGTWPFGCDMLMMGVRWSFLRRRSVDHPISRQFASREKEVAKQHTPVNPGKDPRTSNGCAYQVIFWNGQTWKATIGSAPSNGQILK